MLNGALGLIFLFVLACVIWFSRNAGDERIRRGRCHECGYDLRVQVDRCPECGAWTIPAARAVQRGPLNNDALRRALPSQPIAARKPAPSERYFAVFRTEDPDEAEQLRELFEARGITCSVRGIRSPGGRLLLDNDSSKPIVQTVVREGDISAACDLLEALKCDTRSTAAMEEKR